MVFLYCHAAKLIRSFTRPLRPYRQNLQFPPSGPCRTYFSKSTRCRGLALSHWIPSPRTILNSRSKTLDYVDCRPLLLPQLSVRHLVEVQIKRQKLIRAVRRMGSCVDAGQEVQPHIDGLRRNLEGLEFFEEMERSFVDVERDIDVLLLVVVSRHIYNKWSLFHTTTFIVGLVFLLPSDSTSKLQKK